MLTFLIAAKIKIRNIESYFSFSTDIKKRNAWAHFFLQENTVCITKLFQLEIINISIITGHRKSNYKNKAPP